MFQRNCFDAKVMSSCVRVGKGIRINAKSAPTDIHLIDYYRRNQGPGDHVECHLLKDVFDVDHAVLLGHLLEVVDHLVDPTIQKVQHPLYLPRAERWAQTFPQILC